MGHSRMTILRSLAVQREREDGDWRKKTGEGRKFVLMLAQSVYKNTTSFLHRLVSVTYQFPSCS